jgi:hypothetical protein
MFFEHAAKMEVEMKCQTQQSRVDHVVSASAVDRRFDGIFLIDRQIPQPQGLKSRRGEGFFSTLS